MGENVSGEGPRFSPSTIHPMFLSQLSPSVDLAVAIFLIFIGLTSVLGNGMVLLVYCRKRKKLRPPELLIVNLAICDFGFSFFGAPFFIISSISHAWVFGKTGCLWYGIHGFVFGIGSLLTTCLISVDRCLKICCVRYGQWIERLHVFLSITLMWVYILFWALLPAFGFGSYGAEPFGTSCTINWWRMSSSFNDRIYIFLIMSLCFGVPTIIIISSYLAILLKVTRSNRTLASISSSSVRHTSKDLRLAKVAAVVCSTFLLAWTPYAAVSLISALLPRDDQEAGDNLHTMMEDTAGPHGLKALNLPTLLNWTTAEYDKQIHFDPVSKWSVVNSTSPASITSLTNVTFLSTLNTLNKGAEPLASSPHPYSSLPPIVNLIPAMFAKSHAMINPIIYQIMNKEFRDLVSVLVFGSKMSGRGQAQGLRESSSIYFCQSWRRNQSMSLPVEGKNKSLKKHRIDQPSSGGGSYPFAENISDGADALDFAPYIIKEMQRGTLEEMDG
ncbi:opsin 9 [Halichoeres trimaculatus]|uniref:opsin 9 n=1 Tax=Halichoeres trimaculatus TaxID=147232 RepID=UPI003D9EAED9